jgi:hypothetical protein
MSIPAKTTYTTVKIPTPTYAAAKQLQAEIAKRGVQNLPPKFKNLIESEYCPLCYNKMERLEVNYRFVQCKKCGFSKQALDIYHASASEILGLITAAALIGLGIVALAALLKE